MIQKIICIIFIFFVNPLYAQKDLKVYQFYNHSGSPVSYHKVIKEISNADVVLFGEIHDDPIHHWIQLRLSGDLWKVIENRLILAAEMFDSDDQLAIDEYIKNLIPHDQLKRAIKTWNNYSTDYRPLLELAHDHKLKFIATNVPGRYANFVLRKGIEQLDTLSEKAKRYIAPLPITVSTETPGYQELKEIAEQHGPNIDSEYFLQAQALKDATMAYFINKNRENNHLVLHFNGKFHSDKYGGIYWYLKKYNPELKIKTISSKRNEDLTFKESYKDEADFILVTPYDMIRTY